MPVLASVLLLLVAIIALAIALALLHWCSDMMRSLLRSRGKAQRMFALVLQKKK